MLIQKLKLITSLCSQILIILNQPPGLLGLEKFLNNNYDEMISFLLYQPLRVESGSFSLYIPKYSDSFGNIFYSESQYELEADKKELNYEISYSLNKENFEYKLGTLFIYNGGHIKNNNNKIFILEVKSIYKIIFLSLFLIFSCNKNVVLEEYSSENNCSIEYSDRNIVTEDNRVIIFDGIRPNSKYLFKFISYEFKKNILYIYLKEEKKREHFYK